MGDGPSDRACGDDRRLTTTVEGLASTWKPERGVEGGRGGQEEEPGVVGRGKKTRLASKESSARQFDRGVSLQIIASDRKKKNDLRNCGFSPTRRCTVSPLLSHWTNRPWRCLRAVSQAANSILHGNEIFKKFLPGLKHATIILQRQIYFCFTTCKDQKLGPGLSTR